MCIAEGANQALAPFGGAAYKLAFSTQGYFRSSERSCVASGSVINMSLLRSEKAINMSLLQKRKGGSLLPPLSTSLTGVLVKPP